MSVLWSLSLPNSYWPPYHILSKDDICVRTRVLSDTQQSPCRASLCGGNRLQAFSGSLWALVQTSLRVQEDVVKNKVISWLNPCSAASTLFSSQLASARRVTRAQPSAGVQRLIYCLIAWPQFGVKMAVNVALWRWRKGGESVSACRACCLVKCIGHSLNAWPTD